ncbi:MAG: VIT family protein [Pseudomonadota bacterium]|nr:VIT family protein [Pseudomonadota bacterium]
MPKRRRAHERHQLEGVGWLRASVLGANDGIVSTSSLVLGVAAAHSNHADIILTAAAGLVAGAMSMAIGEYVSVHSQADTETAALDQERAEIAEDFAGESRELTDIYVQRGLDLPLARQVAEQLMRHDALAAHARDELGLSSQTRSRPLQAAFASAASFAAGAALPLLTAAVASPAYLIGAVMITSLLCLLFLGGVSARVGGAPVVAGALRVALWSAVAMGVTAGVGALLGIRS